MTSNPIILASSSPRRQFLMREMGLAFRIELPLVDERYPAEMPPEEVPQYLAKAKAHSLEYLLSGNEILVSADTVVILENRILNKPKDRTNAIQMLSLLSGKTHAVITAVFLITRSKRELISEKTYVKFRRLTIREIEIYIDTFKPFDKAGAYGAQDCLPVGMEPCSEEEMKFLKAVSMPGLVAKSREPNPSGIVLIDNISGSYFNVMGFPIHRVVEHLRSF